MARPLVSLFPLSSFVLGAVCVPHATLIQEDQHEHEHEHELKSGLKISYRSIESQAEAFSKSEKSFSEHTFRVSKEDVANLHVSASRKTVPIVIPLICVFFVLLGLFILKMTYLKQRRLQTIHGLPILPTALHEEVEQESMSGHLSVRVADTLNTTDMRSMRSHASGLASKRSSAESSNNETSRSVPQRTDSAPGILVGLLGSPDWETDMQRELANHQWRLRRESHEASLNSQHRHTWHSQQSYAYSGYSTTRSRPESSVKNKSAERHTRRHSRRRSSLRIPHVPSFGEVDSDTFQDKRRRPKSFNAVVDQMSTSRSASTTDRSPATSIIWQPGSYANDPVGGSGFSESLDARGQRPSTINEVDTSRSTLSRGHDTSFRFRVTDYGGGTPAVNATAHSPILQQLPAQTGSVDSGLGSASMEMSSISTYERLNASGDSSIRGSWKQLPQFPSPPATPISPVPATPETSNIVEVNTICVEPRYLNEQFYSGMIGAKTSSSEILSASGYGLGLLGKDDSTKSSYNLLADFAPSTMDFGWPTLADTLVSDVLNLVLPSPLSEGQCKAVVSSQSSPMVLASELVDGSAQTRLVLEAPMFRRQQTEFLSPYAANLLNRHHSRVREHVPFSLVAPPPAYLRSPRAFERTVRFSSGDPSVVKDDTGGLRPSLHTASLVDLSTPVCPSPLRRMASMGSIGSCASLKGTREPGEGGKEREPSTEGVAEYGKAEAGDNAKSTEHKTKYGTLQDMVEVQAADAPALRPKASHASLFLDLDGSSIGFGDEPSEFYSFDTAETAGIDQSLGYSQASSSGILAVVEEYSHEDIEYIVGLHSKSFSDVQHGMDNGF